MTDRTPLRSTTALLASAAACLALAACAGDAGPAADWTGTVDTLPSGAVRVSNPAQGLWTADERWTLVETLRIGSMSDEGPEIFGQIADVAVDDQGRILVLESQANPGELNVGFGGEVFPADGHIWVNNMFNRRFELFSYEGEAIESTPNPSTYFGAGMVRGDDGALYIRGRVGEGDDARDALFRMVARGDSLVRTDTIFTPELPENPTITASMTNNGNSIVMRLPIPFTHGAAFTFDPAGFFWVDEAEGYRLVQRSVDGEDIRIIEREYTPVPVTEEELAESLERFESGPLASADMDFDRSEIPDVHPPVQRWLTDARDHLWVKRDMGAAGTAWEVFDPEGRYLGVVESEVELSRLTVHQITEDAVYGVLTDELDVPYVVRLAIREGSATAP